MFTGLITDVGTIRAIRAAGNGVRLSVATAYDLSKVNVGASIACDGICLTAETFGADTFEVTAGRETMECTTLGTWKVGHRVHLEQALALGDRLGGHIVSGHVDGVGKVTSIRQDAESWVIWIEVPEELSRYVAEKGSVCVDGVSLTINEVRGTGFRVNIIPHTIASTHMSQFRAGSGVNIEVDLLARYVERLLGRDEGGLTLERLRELGFGG
jgi:riboflavin synthase